MRIVLDRQREVMLGPKTLTLQTCTCSDGYSCRFGHKYRRSRSAVKTILAMREGQMNRKLDAMRRGPLTWRVGCQLFDLSNDQLKQIRRWARGAK